MQALMKKLKHNLKRTAVITGASEGIGAALVNELPGGGINKDTDELKTNMLQSWNEVDAFVSSITGNPKVGLPNQPISHAAHPRLQSTNLLRLPQRSSTGCCTTAQPKEPRCPQTCH